MMHRVTGHHTMTHHTMTHRTMTLCTMTLCTMTLCTMTHHTMTQYSIFLAAGGWRLAGWVIWAFWAILNCLFDSRLRMHGRWLRSILLFPYTVLLLFLMYRDWIT